MGLLNWIQKKLNRKPDALAVSQKTETAMQVNEVTGEVNLSPQAQQDIGKLVGDIFGKVVAAKSAGKKISFKDIFKEASKQVNALEQKNKALGDGTK